MSKSSSLIAALICVLIWGTTFIAQDTGMEFIGPYVFNGIRFFVGFLALIPFFLLLERKKVKSEILKDKKFFIINSMLIGLFLFGGKCSIFYNFLCSNGTNNCFLSL